MSDRPYLSHEDVVTLYKALADRDVYKKSGRMLARPAQPGETVITVVAGKLETLKGAVPGDWVVRNIVPGSSAETYVLDGPKFEPRYTILNADSPWFVDNNSWYEVEPKGMITGGFYDWNAAMKVGLADELEAQDGSGDPLVAPAVTFEAPWGEDMILEDGDFLGRPYPCEDYSDIYRVARAEFFQTYGDTPIFNYAVHKQQREKAMENA